MPGTKETTLQKVTVLSETVAKALGYVLVDVRINQQGRRSTVEVTIYRPQGHIGLEDCEKMSRQLGEALDAEGQELFQGTYLLEVQSPGLSRVLKTARELEVFSGLSVAVKSKQNVGALGQLFSGVLLEHKEGRLKLDKAKPIVVAQVSKGAHKKVPNKIQAVAPLPEAITLDLKDLLEVRLYTEDVPAKK
jgi:ribosome maturation factor RimP